MKTIRGYMKYTEINEEVNKIVESEIEKDDFDFYNMKNEIEKYIKNITTKFYKEAVKFAEENNYNSTPKCLNAYKKWLKENIFKIQKLDINYKNQWQLSKTKYRKVDYETQQADLREQRYEDGEHLYD